MPKIPIVKPKIDELVKSLKTVAPAKEVRLRRTEFIDFTGFPLSE